MTAYEREDSERWRRIFGDEFLMAQQIVQLLTREPSLGRIDLMLTLDEKPSTIDSLLMRMVEHGILNRGGPK